VACSCTTCAQGRWYLLLRCRAVFFNNELVGLWEIAAAKAVDGLDELQFTKLKPAIMYISKLMKLLMEKFNTSIDSIVRDKFTSIQPSVQWKFNEVAWHYFRNREIEQKNDAIGEISFKDVYPLYGTVDIRNSTIERNRALREDLGFQLRLMINLLMSFYEEGFGPIYLELAGSCNEWLTKIEPFFSVEDEWELNDFLITQVQPSLSLEHLPQGLNNKVNEYYESLNEQTGGSFFKKTADGKFNANAKQCVG
jgi:hypothetical protein